MDKLDSLRYVTSKKSVQDSNPGFQRLPTYATPLNYTIILKPDLETFDVIGVEEIYLQINTPTKELVLHAKNLKVAKAEWGEDGSGKRQLAKTIKYNEVEDLLILSFQDFLAKGKGYLILNFQGLLSDDMLGFYRARDVGANGEDIFNALTQFEPTSARSSFVCYDEPSLKATFDISLVVPKNKVALSNMPIKDQKPYECDDNLVVVTFQRSVIMSTYLVAFAVGEFDFVESFTSDRKVLCRVYTPVGRKDQGLYALDMCTKLIPYFNEYFGIEYPLNKIDLLACSDFDAGAMENFGLVLFRERSLLLDPDVTTLFNTQEIALVVAHELSHQWFGNLVTMEWWDGLFLKEGYATFMETMATDHLFPDFDMWSQFVADTVIDAMKMDVLQSTHPIEVPVYDPIEINSIFDDISYKKGGSLLRMARNYLGESAFRKGMSIYLNRHKYKNTKTEDLWRALEEGSGKPMTKMMPTWTQQIGFPILKVDARQEGKNRVLKITQQKFRYHNSEQIPKSKFERSSYNWHIPLTFCAENEPSKVIEGQLMTTESLTVTIPNIRADQWLKLNPGFVGYYVVNYSPETLSEFIPAIRDKSMGALDRLNLLHDTFSIAKAGEISTVEALKVLEAFQYEDNYTVWLYIDKIMVSLCSLLMSTGELYNQLRSFGLNLYSSIAEKIGWVQQQNESHLHTLLRPLILSRLVSFNHPATINTSLKQFHAHMNDNAPIYADLKSLVFKAALSVGDQKTYDAVIQYYMNAEMQEEKLEIASALAGSKNVGLLEQALKFSLSEKVRPQDSVHILRRLSFNGNGRDLVWNFLKENVKSLEERHGSRGALDRLVICIAESFVTKDQVDDMRRFFKKNKFGLAQSVIDEAVETAVVNQEWLQRDQAKITEFLLKY